MLEDRDYMRQPEYRTSRVSWTMVILIVNAIIFLVQLASQKFPHGQDIQDQYFALSLDGMRHGYFWQLLTFQFMHSTSYWPHIVFNSLAIYFAGPLVENTLGRNRFLGLYFISGIIGGLMQMLFALATHSYDAAVVGASAGASGLIAAFAVICWEEELTFLLMFFIPVTMRGKTLLWISIGIAVVMMLIPGSNIANAAHLGGILTGFFYARYALSGHWPQWNFFQRRERPREAVTTHAQENKSWSSAPAGEEPSAGHFMQNEVDPILDKISAHGIQSLTARERAILESARKKMTNGK